MKRLDLALLLSLLGAFLLSVGGFIVGDATAGWCGHALMLLIGATIVINLLLDIRNELRRRQYGLGHG